MAAPPRPDPPFASSSQRLHWTFTPATLSQLAQQRHGGSLLRVAGASLPGSPAGAGAGAGAGVKRPRTEDASPLPAEALQKRARGADGAVGGAAADAPPPYLTLEEEAAVIRWAGFALLRLCRCAGLDRAVTATALTFFRRFFVSGLLVEYPPHEMMCVARAPRRVPHCARTVLSLTRTRARHFFAARPPCSSP